MANTTVTEAVCDLCGVEIRDGSLFCYNCGTAVKPKVEVEEPPVKPQPTKRPPLRSAASLRQQRRAANRQPLEVRWEPKEQTPKLFVIASVVLALGALALLLIALYLR